MKMIAGLGNPGKKYENQRHNLGFMVIDSIADSHQIDINEKKFKADFGKGSLNGESVILVKPQTFMNLSGEAINQLARYFKIDVEDVIVIADDLNIDFGRIRIRKKGSDGGHNGLKSISQCLGSQEFPRVRVGIGLPKEAYDVSNFVLSQFKAEEKEELDKLVKRSAEATVTIVTQSIDEGMQQFNS